MASHKQIERYCVFAFGVLFVIVMLGLAIWNGEPTPTQWFVFRVVLALAAAGIAAFVPGFFEFTVPSYVRAGGALAVFAFVLMYTPASLVTEEPNLSRNEQSVLDLKDEVMILRGAWETRTPMSKAKVSSAAPALAEAIVRVADNDLRLGYRLVKYQYATYAYVMACDTETRAIATDYCQKAVTHGTKYVAAIDEAQALATDSGYNNAIAKWVRDSRQTDRAKLLLARANALLFRITDDQTYVASACEYCDALSPAHTQEYPLEYDKVLKPILSRCDSIGDVAQRTDVHRID